MLENIPVQLKEERFISFFFNITCYREQACKLTKDVLKENLGCTELV